MYLDFSFIYFYFYFYLFIYFIYVFFFFFFFLGGGYGGPPLTGASSPVLDVYNYCVVGNDYPLMFVVLFLHVSTPSDGSADILFEQQQPPLYI